MSSIKAHLAKTNPERVEKFMADAPAAVKTIMADIKNLQVAIESHLTHSLLSQSASCLVLK